MGNAQVLFHNRNFMMWYGNIACVRINLHAENNNAHWLNSEHLELSENNESSQNGRGQDGEQREPQRSECEILCLFPSTHLLTCMLYYQHANRRVRIYTAEYLGQMRKESQDGPMKYFTFEVMQASK